MSNRNRRTVRLSLEPLEPRETPAGGIVTVNVLNGSVTLTGDAAGNDVRLLETAANTVAIMGQNGTLVRLGTGGAAITEIDDVVITKNLTVRLGNGADHFDYTGTFNSRIDDIAVTTGTGDDTVSIGFLFARNVSVVQGAAAGATDNDSVTINGSFRGNVMLDDRAGSDTVTFTAAVLGNLTVANQDGADTVSIGGVVGGNLAVTDTATKTTVAGNAFTLSNLQVGHNVTITSPGNFVQTITLGTVVVGGSLTVSAGSSAGLPTTVNVSNAVVGVNLSVSGGAGDDSVTLASVRVGKNLNVSNNAGTNTTTLDGAHVGGSLSVSGTSGSDTVNLGANFGVVVGGNGTFNLGDGSNTLAAGANGQSAEFGGNFSVTTGGGVDQITMALLTVQGNANVNLGAGNDLLTVQSSATFAGNTLVNAGAGDDQISVNADNGTAISFLGNMNLTLGAGIDTLNIGTSNGTVWLLGNLLSDASTADTIDVGANFLRPGF
jgi:hypothetical protein